MHVSSKHGLIYPSTEELSAVQKAVQVVEAALKEVSGIIHEQELKVFLASSHKLVHCLVLLILV